MATGSSYWRIDLLQSVNTTGFLGGHDGGGGSSQSSNGTLVAMFLVLTVAVAHLNAKATMSRQNEY
jgi:hypothetical protein